MDLIKFCGKDKRDSIKKALTFFYDNYDDSVKVETFLAKCRVQEDKKTIYYYPNIKVDLKKLKELKNELEERKKK